MQQKYHLLTRKWIYLLHHQMSVIRNCIPIILYNNITKMSNIFLLFPIDYFYIMLPMEFGTHQESRLMETKWSALSPMSDCAVTARKYSFHLGKFSPIKFHTDCIKKAWPMCWILIWTKNLPVKDSFCFPLCWNSFVSSLEVPQLRPWTSS